MSNEDEYRRAKRTEYKAKTQPPQTLTRDEFLEWRAPREVLAGPESLDNPTWHWLVRTRLSAGSASSRFSPDSREVGPMWCFDRTGMSQTTLSDGRVIYVAGEHEDHYDPDFYIYNDVVIVDPDGSIHIRGYSRAQFIATDFHTATLIGNSILLIGCLGYPTDRIVGVTPVYKLTLDTWCIERVMTYGESPGWLHCHSAELSEDGDFILVNGGIRWLGAHRSMRENIDNWSLNIHSGQWSQLTARDWQQWSMRRIDLEINRLADLRRALWHHEHPTCSIFHGWEYQDAPNFTELTKLYCIDDDAPPPIEIEHSSEFIVIVDGLTIRFAEDYFGIDVVVEGRLTQKRLIAYQSRILTSLETVDGAAWEIEPTDISPEMVMD